MLLLEPEAIGVFSQEARQAIYDCIALRRDVRHFKPRAVLPDDVLRRVLSAAHQAPSVGFSQPWAFIVVNDPDVRARIRRSFLQCRAAEAARFPPERRESYLAHKLEGIVEASVNLCVAVDLRDRGEAVLGTTAQPEALRASACCAVQNLWLAARAEGIGVGWVSIVEPQVLRQELALPAGVEPIAYLCLGEPVAFRRRPMLEETGWQARAPLDAVLHWHNRFEEAVSPPQLRSAAPRQATTPVSDEAAQAMRVALSKLAKPVGSLGRLEELCERYAAAHGTYPVPALEHACLLLFAADHGVTTEGVSAYGSQHTAAVVRNVMAGGAAINTLAREQRVELRLFDVGVAGDLSAAPRNPVVPLFRATTGAATENMRRAAAMSGDRAEQALAAGRAAARRAVGDGARALGVGEIGIGNTTAAAALTCVFTGASPAASVGNGTGIDDDAKRHKQQVVSDALALHRPSLREPFSALCAVGGLEISAMVGAILGAAEHRVPVVLDGFVTLAAALVAVAMDSSVRGYLIASHASTEPGARIALAHLDQTPLLDLGMRLGEGTGACLALGMLRSAVALSRNMATFATAGIVDRLGTST
jgi:nicotinate-nucleotide--dimethylbenzimidazole phosphoribosyltransferase